MDPRDRILNLFLGFSSPPFDPEDIGDVPEVARVLGRWWGEDTEGLRPEAMRAVFAFTQEEMFHRFREIAEVAATLFPIPEFKFDVQGVAHFRTFAHWEDGSPLIFLDRELLDFWFAFFASRLFETYAARTAEERAGLTDFSLLLLDHMARGRRVPEEPRALLMPWFAGDEHLARVAASVSRTVAYFGLAHELAHVALNHSALDADPFPLELQADVLAAKVQLALRDRRDLEWATLPDGYLGAALLLFDLLHATRMAGTAWGMRPRDRGYPSPRQRRAVVARVLAAGATDKDRGVYIDLRMSMARMNVVLHQRRRGAVAAPGRDPHQS
jgi:hypothetical protein